VANKPLDPKLALGLRIKQLRAEKEITQEELADRCDLFRTYMSRIESGLANPTLTVLHTLAQGLEVSLNELLLPPTIVRPQRVRAAKPVSRGRVSK
jgi:transcriptional regulator with XRE-family HTH domain